MLTKCVYDFVSKGKGIDAAAEEEIGVFFLEISLGVIVLSRAGYSAGLKGRMAYAVHVSKG